MLDGIGRTFYVRTVTDHQYGLWVPPVVVPPTAAMLNPKPHNKTHEECLPQSDSEVGRRHSASESQQAEAIVRQVEEVTSPGPTITTEPTKNVQFEVVVEFSEAVATESFVTPPEKKAAVGGPTQPMKPPHQKPSRRQMAIVTIAAGKHDWQAAPARVSDAERAAPRTEAQTKTCEGHN